MNNTGQVQGNNLGNVSQVNVAQQPMQANAVAQQIVEAPPLPSSLPNPMQPVQQNPLPDQNQLQNIAQPMPPMMEQGGQIQNFWEYLEFLNLNIF